MVSYLLPVILKKNRKLALQLLYVSRTKKRKVSFFNLHAYNDTVSLSLFRFKKEDILKLRILLKIPWKIVCINGTICNGIEALCITLRRLAYPNRLVDLELLFKRPRSEISYIVNHMLHHIVETFGHLLTDMNHWWLSKESLEIYSTAVFSKGSPLPRCWGFIDGTVRAMCRPTKFQQDCYNGHKRVHALKYQSIVIPNGLIANLFGPIEGRRHDAFMLAESGILGALEEKNQGEHEPFYIYGDPAYPLRTELQAPFKGSHITPEQAQFNNQMSKCRISVEWCFGKVLSLFAFVDFKKNQRLYLQPLSLYFKVAVLFTNIHTCLYGSMTSKFFGVDPPKLEEYLE